MNKYYAQKLSAERLELCYKLAPLRVKKYLEAEIKFVVEKIKDNDTVLELGCGYGRIFPELLTKANAVFGIDNSYSNLKYAKEKFQRVDSVYLFQMNAANLGFREDQFDAVICIQNGISAFKVDQMKLVEETKRITRKGGQVFFSSYSEKFWDHRMEWFQIQSEHDLIGEIDYEKTGNGVIVCKDGFKAVTITKDDFISLTLNTRIVPEIIEVDDSSVFCFLKV